jgi:hypothetical protein
VYGRDRIVNLEQENAQCVPTVDIENVLQSGCHRMVIYLCTNIKNVFVSLNIFFLKHKNKQKTMQKKQKQKQKKIMKRCA